jgi:hypothetical protein
MMGAEANGDDETDVKAEAELPRARHRRSCRRVRRDSAQRSGRYRRPRILDAEKGIQRGVRCGRFTTQQAEEGGLLVLTNP